MSDNRLSQIAGGMLPAAKCRFMRDMRYGDKLIRCIYLMSPAVLKRCVIDFNKLNKDCSFCCLQLLTLLSLKQ